MPNQPICIPSHFAWSIEQVMSFSNPQPKTSSNKESWYIQPKNALQQRVIPPHLPKYTHKKKSYISRLNFYMDKNRETMSCKSFKQKLNKIEHKENDVGRRKKRMRWKLNHKTNYEVQSFSCQLSTSNIFLNWFNLLIYWQIICETIKKDNYKFRYNFKACRCLHKLRSF